MNAGRVNGRKGPKGAKGGKQGNLAATWCVCLLDGAGRGDGTRRETQVRPETFGATAASARPPPPCCVWASFGRGSERVAVSRTGSVFTVKHRNFQILGKTHGFSGQPGARTIEPCEMPGSTSPTSLSLIAVFVRVLLTGYHAVPPRRSG